MLNSNKSVLLNKQTLFLKIEKKIKLQTAAPNEMLKFFIGLSYVNRALDKIKEESYGICDECGDDIPEARLLVVPGAVFCANCLSKKEKGR